MFVKHHVRQTDPLLPRVGGFYRFHDCEVQVIATGFDRDLDVSFVFYRYTNHCYSPGERHRMDATSFQSQFAGKFQTPENVLEFAA